MEDTTLSVPDMEARFAKEVTTIVDGVTKLGRVQFQDPDAYEKVCDLMVMRVLTLSPTS